MLTPEANPPERLPTDLAEAQLQQELYAIFEVETQKYLQNYIALVQQLQPQSWSEDIQELYRSIHTIKGGAVSVGADTVVQIATALEDLLSDLRYLESAPPLEDGQLEQMLLEAGELLASSLHIQEVVDQASGVEPTVKRIQTLKKAIQQTYIPNWSEQQQVYQEFAAQGFDLVVLDLEMALEQLPAEGTVPSTVADIARHTLHQLEQIGNQLQFASGWTQLLEKAQVFLDCLENTFWHFHWSNHLQALKDCAKQGGKLNNQEAVGQLPSTLRESQTNKIAPEIKPIQLDSTIPIPSADELSWVEEDSEFMKIEEADSAIDEVSLTQVQEMLAQIDRVEKLAQSNQEQQKLSPVNEQQFPPSVAISNRQFTENFSDKSLIPIPLERLDLFAQSVVETLLASRTCQGIYHTLQNQILKLIAAARENAHYITRLRQIQDEYALLDDSKLEFISERYSQEYATINRLLETNLRLSELGTEVEKAAQQTAESLQHLDLNIHKLQNAVEDSRLISFKDLSFRAKAILRDLTNRYGKPAQLVVRGEQIELDVSTAKKLEPALLHLLRNAYDHGLEPPAERVAKGKPEQGTITLSLRRRGNIFSLELQDDGRGIDAQAIQAKAITQGCELISTETPRELLAVLCQPGFSSQIQVNQLSGRGVGLDVVAAQVANLGGSLRLDTHLGTGTTFRIQFPVSHLLVPCVLIQSGDRLFGIPTEEIVTTTLLNNLQVSPNDDSNANYSWIVHEETEDLAGLNLLEYWQMASSNHPLSNKTICICVRNEQTQQKIWLFADELIGRADLAIDPLPAPLISPDGLLGVSLYIDGTAIPIIETATLIERIVSSSTTTLRELNTQTSTNVFTNTSKQATENLSILVVDDAALVRRQIEASLTAFGYIIHTCADGLEAWNWLQVNPNPALIISDIEMPAMDGFTLINRCRQIGITSQILVISSRLSEDWIEEARRLGATDYLTKGFSTAQLLDKVNYLLGSL
jgi:chemotaxis family two-component system sensor histidine kinase/response regulator PixL